MIGLHAGTVRLAAALPDPAPVASQVQRDQASQAASELPDKVDTGNAQHAAMLSKYGIGPATVTDKPGSTGKAL
jgi:hypothetical protein